MTPAAKRVLAGLVLPALAVAWGGCVGFAVPGYGLTPVYGGYGYVGPWEGPPVVVEGGYLAPPPYARPDRGRRENVAPERRAPGPRPAGGPIPSIPNHPRPARQGGGGTHR